MFSIFNKYKNVLAVLSQKADGSMKLAARDKKILENRKRFFKKLGITDDWVVSAGLVHGHKVKTVSIKNRENVMAQTDGLITADKNTFLALTVADCLPIFLYDFKKEIIGLIHGGWRSLAKGIIPLAIEKFINDFGSQPQNILAGIGPGISSCHFEVRKDVLSKFGKFLPAALIEKNHKTFLDLKKIVVVQLLNCGLKKEYIEVSPECTYCLNKRYFSFRRDQSDPLKTMLAVAGMK